MSASVASATRHDWSLAEVRRCSSSRSTTCCSRADRAPRALRPEPRAGFRPCCRSRPAPVRDCGYCPQSGHYNTGPDKQKLMEVQKVLEAAAEPRPSAPPASAWARRGSTRRPRTCPTRAENGRRRQGWAWRPCMTLGKLDQEQTARWPPPASTTTTTTWTPRRSSTATSSPPEPTPSACRPWPTCARRG